MDAIPPLHQQSEASSIEAMPTTAGEQKPPPGRAGPVFAVVIVLVIAVAGYAGAAYYFKLWPLGGGVELSKQQAYDALFSKIAAIEAASYDVLIDVKAEQREAGVSSFDVTFPEFDTNAESYKRDYDRLRDVESFMRVLTHHYIRNQSYPTTTDELIAWSQSGLSYSDKLSDQIKQSVTYAPNANRDNYTLAVTLETDAAIAAVRKFMNTKPQGTTTINGKTVTFTKGSPQYFYFRSTPARPEWVSFLERDSLAYVSSDIAFTISVGGTAQRHKDAKADARFHLGGKLALGDLNVEADGEFLKKGETYFGRINKFPSLFLDLSKIKGQWVKIEPHDLTSLGALSYEQRWVGESQQKMSELVKQLQTVFRISNEEKVLLVDVNLPDEKVGERDAYVYQVSFDERRVVPWYERLSAELKKDYGDDAIIKLDEASLQFMKTAAFEKYLAYVKNNTIFRIFIDKESGFPARFTYRLRYVPAENAKWENKQLTTLLALTLTDINTPIQVKEPDTYLTFEDAQIALTGESKEQYRFRTQIGYISAVRAALTSYYGYAGNYPSQLSELLKKRSEFIEKPALGSSQDGASDVSTVEDDLISPYQPGDTPFLKAVPNDVYTGAAYPYKLRNDSAGYEVQYQMVIPPREKNPQTGTSAGFFSSVRRILRVNEVVKYKNGLNTATAQLESIEGSQQLQLDSDNDRLPDVVEAYYGSDKAKADSDGDTYSDYEEVKNGYDPAGPGRLPDGDIWTGSIPIPVAPVR